MYPHPPVLQRARRPSEDESLSNTKGDKYPLLQSPTQASFHQSPTGRSQHSKPSTPLQPSFNGPLQSPHSPQTSLPPIASTTYPRETPVSNYYDPTQDTGERSVNRSGARYEPYGAEVSTTKSNPSKNHCHDKHHPTTNCANTFPSISAETITIPPNLPGHRYQVCSTSPTHLINRQSHHTSHTIHHSNHRCSPTHRADQTPWPSRQYRRVHIHRTALRHPHRTSCHTSGGHQQT